MAYVVVVLAVLAYIAWIAYELKNAPEVLEDGRGNRGNAV